jgi:hypothetical protein
MHADDLHLQELLQGRPPPHTDGVLGKCLDDI